MNKELEILKLADYAEKIEYKEASCYLIINKKLKEHQCMFGFVNLPEDFATVRKLFNKVEQRAKELGYDEIIGPMNYDTWMSYRWALNDYGVRYFPDCENPRYYVDYIKKLGYKELYTYRSAHVKIYNKLYWLGKIISVKKKLEMFKFEFVDGEAAYSKVKEIFEISTDAFCEAYLYSKIPFKYFERIYLEWIKKIDNVAVYMVYKDGEPIAFEMGYLNPYNKKEFITKTIAVKKKYQGRKLYVALLYLGCKYVKSLGLDEVIFHFQCEQKSSFKRFDGDIESREKRYAMFVKELNEV